MRIRPGTEKDLEAWLSLRLALWPETPEAQHRVEIGDILADSAENGDLLSKGAMRLTLCILCVPLSEVWSRGYA